jgi:hypothetical protein
MNREKMGELRKAETEEIDKAVPTVLKADQVKRLKQLEVQAGGLRALSKEDVQTSLKLTDAQKKSIKDSTDELTKDVQEMFQSAGGDRSKMAEMFTKIQGMQKEALEKAVNSLNDDQKKEWKELNGAKFEFPARTGGRRPSRATKQPRNVASAPAPAPTPNTTKSRRVSGNPNNGCGAIVGASSTSMTGIAAPDGGFTAAKAGWERGFCLGRGLAAAGRCGPASLVGRAGGAGGKSSAGTVGASGAAGFLSPSS